MARGNKAVTPEIEKNTIDTDTELLEGDVNVSEKDEDSANKIKEKTLNDASEVYEQLIDAEDDPKAVTFRFKARNGMLALKTGNKIMALRGNVSQEIPEKKIMQAKNHLFITNDPVEIGLLDKHIAKKKKANVPCEVMRFDPNKRVEAPLPSFVEMNIGGRIVKAESARLSEKGYVESLTKEQTDLLIKHD